MSSSQSQAFKIFEMSGTIRSTNFSVSGGLNIHSAVSDYLNDIHQQINPYDPNDLTKKRTFHVVYGYPELDSLHTQLFAEGAKDKPDFDDKFDEYYYRAFLTANQDNRSLLGKEFSEQAFSQAPEFMSLHVTISLQ